MHFATEAFYLTGQVRQNCPQEIAEIHVEGSKHTKLAFGIFDGHQGLDTLYTDGLHCIQILISNSALVVVLARSLFSIIQFRVIYVACQTYPFTNNIAQKITS